MRGGGGIIRGIEKFKQPQMHGDGVRFRGMG